jgi:hydrogenase nickel incorporation protein HypA/HybF
MHELALTQSIVDIVARHAGGRAVRRVTLAVGKLACVMPDAIRFCFDIVATGTALEGARLEIIEVEAWARCRACGEDFARETLWTACPCGARDFEPRAGQELLVKDYEVDADAVGPRPAEGDGV